MVPLQVEDYALRKNLSVAEVEKWLEPILGYDTEQLWYLWVNFFFWWSVHQKEQENSSHWKQLSSVHPNSLSDCLKFLIKELDISNQICPVPLAWDHECLFLSHSSILLFIFMFCTKTLAEKLGVGWDGETAKLSCSVEDFEIKGKNFSAMAVDMHGTQFDFCYFSVFWQVRRQKYDVIFLQSHKRFYTEWSRTTEVQQISFLKLTCSVFSLVLGNTHSQW